MKVPDSMREGHDSIGDEHQLSLKLCVLPRQSLPASNQTLKTFKTLPQVKHHRPSLLLLLWLHNMPSRAKLKIYFYLYAEPTCQYKVLSSLSWRGYRESRDICTGNGPPRTLKCLRIKWYSQNSAQNVYFLPKLCVCISVECFYLQKYPAQRQWKQRCWYLMKLTT